MIEVVCDNRFRKVFFDKKNQFYKSIWTTDSSEMKEEDVVTEITSGTKLLMQLKPTLCLIDERNRGFLYTVDIQNWVAITIEKASIQAGVKKMGIIMPRDLISELCTQQIVQEVENDVPFEIMYFQNEVQALEWLDV